MNNQIKSIRVLGSGCPTCKKLLELTKRATRELGLNTEVEYVTDMQKIIELGVMSAPVLAVNGKAVLAGQLPNLEKIKELITANDKPIVEKTAGDYSCCGDC